MTQPIVSRFLDLPFLLSIVRVLFQFDFLSSPAPGLASLSSVDRLREHFFSVILAEGSLNRKMNLLTELQHIPEPSINTLESAAPSATSGNGTDDLGL